MRVDEIKQMRKEGLTYQEIGAKFNISASRVSQIINTTWSYCGVHQRQFIKACLVCINVKKFGDRLDKSKKLDNSIQDEIARLGRRVRTKEVVLQRQMLVKKLRDQFGLSFSEIGRLLGRHHTSIINLYEKNN